MMQNAHLLPTIAFFNDRFRDYVKGSTFHLGEQGFALGNSGYREQVKRVIEGSHYLFSQPTQTVNYVESHDNHTLWDKISVANYYERENVRKKRQKLATAITLLAQGIPFLHSGQEFYRTKQGVENSYNAPDTINRIDWTRKSMHEEDVRYVQGLIRLRKWHGAFRFQTVQEIRNHLLWLEPMPLTVLAFHLHDVSAYGPWSDIIVIHHNEETPLAVALPDEEIWYVVCDESRSGIDPLYAVTKKIELQGIGTVVLVKGLT
ncbi:alpha amylase, catalytic domain protein (plasmid) [Anoxybacillus amylolyticus]|uniref:Alpha amylase, catalytic domain protein n=1 Tax=Anoxybacteroides amylolyticum TaxID=294699 RepID=A0A160F7N0_9BACL|nr:alpha amylase, catalytic domain protein [Anoxybacillus amylolyticus]